MTAPRARTRSGRRPGNQDTRSRILAVARKLFAQNGFDKTSVRAVALSAGVDAALVHHYFGTKRQLFLDSVDIPVDPTQVIAPVLDIPTDKVGRHLAEAVFSVWESPHRPAVVAAFRSAMAGNEPTLIRTFLVEVVFRDLGPRVDEPPGTGILRMQLVASQMVGILVTRYILEFEPLASLPIEDLVDVIAPTLQRYLTGPVPA
ncbi:MULTISPECIES: TetR/AcrR family transcriptional regulator [Rhodococcus]|uniref:TetR family transcriptional regulator n=1 Tax=Rhodococcus oxybenzonivorans TaxID=1990687 RepID=A0AAE4UV56_9NOCA|nr:MULTISPECIES: TetR family transcriptional regulator [Rhodococcus]MDV7244027.1 TetR family transcriptional regulator [Rhodococcus oxybenzonivorans]MDV7263192.1 TetR family transcriptional regulator [Rhodococcus oxybenzonivorans]MDV7274731.1 TetR family transcriptional regulator [Rhodococcus oxybenzonivorans]MDV7336044.1 TetR family transcriptional regulator [Rhodococcus oxybenzonivorans]MDV7345681.1 TetR family transcriptional regulator [Rhodococcus oxybenzonivorans]